MIQKRAWSNKFTNIKPVNMLYLEPSTSVIVAVSQERGLVQLQMKTKSFKAADFLNFIKRLERDKFNSNFDLILDNATIHKAGMI